MALVHLEVATRKGTILILQFNPIVLNISAYVPLKHGWQFHEIVLVKIERIT